MEGIMTIIAIFQTIVLLDRQHVDQPQIVSLFLQSIDQPVPVEGGLYRDTLQGIPVRRQCPERQRLIVVQTLFQHPLVLFIDHNHNVIV